MVFVVVVKEAQLVGAKLTCDLNEMNDTKINLKGRNGSNWEGSDDEREGNDVENEESDGEYSLRCKREQRKWLQRETVHHWGINIETKKEDRWHKNENGRQELQTELSIKS